jgi:hypothetical protein
MLLGVHHWYFLANLVSVHILVWVTLLLFCSSMCGFLAHHSIFLFGSTANWNGILQKTAGSPILNTLYFGMMKTLRQMTITNRNPLHAISRRLTMKRNVSHKDENPSLIELVNGELLLKAILARPGYHLHWSSPCHIDSPSCLYHQMALNL